MAWYIDENSFEAGAAGSTGTLNYSTGFGTPAGGNISQIPDKFSSNDKTTNHFNNATTQSYSISKNLPSRTDRKSSSGAPIHPADMTSVGGNSQPGDQDTPNTVPFNAGGPIPADDKSVTDFPDSSDQSNSGGEDYYPNGGPDTDNETNPNNSPDKEEPSKGGVYQNAVANKDANPDNKEFDKDVDQMFQKKITPTPDELLSALQYEMNQMVKKDKYIAKSIVLKNLKRDPKYYSRLDMLNIDDDKMKVDENSTIFKTKSLLDKMIAERQARSSVKPITDSPEISKIFKDLRDKRYRK